ncbi:DNA-binding protein [Fictibacillus nanhaiensis]|uniref:DNA-binding protein n=1 Tax=Fictibacillus nanhaiensis TaxID=742169 RepID=UPI001C93B4E5|nr:DNA-binding protein [Fictibacillus nanhaiensis]MBY6037864.1 DNA-binding protein [Fictibacillus nanhaiensis]
MKASFLRSALVAISLILPTVFSSEATSVLAEGPTDPAPEIQAKVVNENFGKKVLFDNTHGQTAGAADWVIDGAFSDFANALANDGYYVKELRKTTPITYTDLQSYDVFVLPEANIPYKVSEQDALIQYVENGGSLFFVSDHYNADRNKNRWDASEIFNGYRRGAWSDPAKGMTTGERSSDEMTNVASSDWLSNHFGLRFRYNAIGDVTANDIVSPADTFGITQGVSTVAMHAGSTLAITDPYIAKGIVYLPQTTAKWTHAVDQGVYNGGGRAEGPYAAISKKGLGKAAFIGDSSPVEDATPKYLREETGATKKTYDGFLEQNDSTLLVNMVNWLSVDESYTSFVQAGIPLDPATALLAMEDPASSTEPQAEPWSAPASGYLWYDSSTFKSGSYGAGSGQQPPPATNGYYFEHQAILSNYETFQVRVNVDGLSPNTTYTNYNLGVYTSNGTQVAKVQNSNGTWPSSYGYSSYFSLTTDSTGHAEKVLNVQIKSGTTGSANMRLRQNSTAKHTTSVTIGNVPAEPLPY